MQFFSALKSMAVEANEEAHGARLLNDTQTNFACIEELDGRLQYAIMLGYLQIRARLIQGMLNWSSEGRIKVGREMQAQAREKYNLDMAGSYSKWLAGAWIESKERNSLKAQQAFGSLEGFARYIENEVAK